MFPKTGHHVPDLDLLDEAGKPAKLSSVAGRGPLLLLAFGGPVDATGLSLLRDLRDCTLVLGKAGISICGIAQADPMSLAWLRAERGLGFPLFADPDGWLRGTGLLLVDRRLVVMQHSVGAGVDVNQMLYVIRRGAARPSRWRDRVVRLLLALSHAIAPRLLAR